MKVREAQAARLDFAVTMARAEVHRLLTLFPSLQAEFTSTNHTGPADSPESAARARRLEYGRQYRERQKNQKAAGLPGHSAAARKKLSLAMKARWKAAKEAGTSLNVKTAQKTGTVINAAEAIQAQLKTETARQRKNRIQREWRANQKKKGVR